MGNDVITVASAKDDTFQTHCGADGFSPQAPDCGQYVIPEPSTVALVLLAAIVWRVVRALVAGRDDRHAGVVG